ncbi:MAG TPA: hypothetical protein PKW45_18565, partial [Bryobacteraceae bacterium]|nr:hypothetical protein [Bryobacteraceae bacterium]
MKNANKLPFDCGSTGEGWRPLILSEFAKKNFWGIAIFVGVAARLWLWWRFIGSNDPHIWAQHANHILTLGLEGAYVQVRILNHPPLMAWMSALCAVLTELAGGGLLNFARLIKAPGVIAEFATITLLWRFGSSRAAAVYALSPVAILISGFHGNTDPLCAALILAGAVMASRERWFLGGIGFAAAINVKLIPLLLVPALLVSASQRARTRLVAGLSLAVVPFLPPALSVAPAMYRNIVNYVPSPAEWGVTAFLDTAARTWYSAHGRFVVVCAILCLALWSRWNKMPLMNQLAAACALWLILTPGFGVQYLIYVVPLVCMVDLRYAVLWSCSAGAMLATLYWTGLEKTAHPLSSWMPQSFRDVQPAL